MGISIRHNLIYIKTVSICERIYKIWSSLSITQRHIILISAVYFLAHCFLLVLNGQWWDEWSVYNGDYERLLHGFYSSGRPWAAWFIYPFHFYHINPWRTTFFIYFLSSILFYFLLIRLPGIQRNDGYWMALLFTIIPVNDVRAVTVSIFQYSLGVMFFVAASLLLVIWGQMENCFRKIIVRLLTLMMFFLSFTMNSNIVFYVMVLLYIHSLNEFSWGKFYKFLDFFVLPFVFFVGQNTLFPPNAVYAKYYEISLNNIIAALEGIIPAFFSIWKQIVFNLFEGFRIPFVAIGCFAIVIIALLKYNGNDSLEYQPANQWAKSYFLLGTVAFLLSIFPYLVISAHSHDTMSTVGVGSRDCTLVPFGCSIMIYYLLKLIPIKQKVGQGIYCVIVVLGIIHFNTWYLIYQQDYYRQLALMNQIKLCDEIKHNKTFIFLDQQPTKINGTRFYSLRENVVKALNSKGRFIGNGFYDIRHMPKDRGKIDGLLVYFNYIPLDHVMKLKYYELFYPEFFSKEVIKHAKLQYISLNQADSDSLLKAFDRLK